ncbi:uncharacterized protein LOC130053876 [Ostrea edulis]|uniref:uncharacterized protein LOC130053876 n=1 Tax=Ostrea edulis TaxID=37623 RepID=UPI0024AF4AD8|nr:uncharacterized protein LOC130053876 [Ostrea edulis]
MYEDNQKSGEGSQDMFESQESAQLAPVNDGSGCTAPCRGCAENTKLLHTILQELRELREGLNARSGDYKKFVMENSDIEAPLLEFLKTAFLVKMFLSTADLELKLLSGKKDAENLSVQDLGKELFQRFSPVLNNQIEQTTVVLC